jgi:hypothetical protein
VGGVEEAYLASALRGGEWPASHLCRFYHGEKVSGTNGRRGCASPRTDLNAWQKKRISLPCRKSTIYFGRPACSLPSQFRGRAVTVPVGFRISMKEGQFVTVAYRGGFGGFKPPLPKFRRFDKAEPNSLFRGKYIRNNPIRMRVSLICKLSGTPD